MNEYNEDEGVEPLPTEGYEEPQPESSPEEVQQEVWDGVSEPRPSEFTDYDQFVSAIAEYKTKAALNEANAHFSEAGAIGAAVRDGVAAAMAPPVNPAIPDDPHKWDRARADNWIKDCRARAEVARVQGNKELAKTWEQRALWAVADLEKLPPPPDVVMSENFRDDLLDRATQLLFDPKHKDDKVWNHPRMLNDAPVALVEANARAKKIIRLPLTDDGARGNPLEVRPGNMVSVELPPEVMKRFKDDVYRSGRPTNPDSIIRDSWDFLIASGYANNAVRAFEPKGERGSASQEGEVDPSKLSFAEFCKWREGVEERKHGKKQGFIMPQARKRNE